MSAPLLLHGRYTVALEPAGGGQFGAVYLGRDVLLDREVAIKRVHSIGDATSEARTIAAVAGHPAMLEAYDAFEHAGKGWLVTSRVVGALLGRDDRGQKRKLAEAVGQIKELLRGLRHMHERRFLHTDVKPENVIVLGDQRVGMLKLIDLGGAVKVNKNTGTWTGRPNAGCQLYMPPEQFGSSAVLDVRSDVYQAAGVLLYLLTGRPKVPGWPLAPAGLDQEQEDRYMSEHCLPIHAGPLNVDMPEGPVKQLLVRALDPDPARRFASAQAMLDALEMLPKDAHPR